MDVRKLDEADAPVLEAFLAQHRDSSMFLRSNIRQSGVNFRTEPFHALHVGSFHNGLLTGVVAHAWNGMLLVQAPLGVEELARECVRISGRTVTGLAGPLEQVKQARTALGLTSSPVAMESDEWLYALNLSDLIMPDCPLKRPITCRPPLETERVTVRVAVPLRYGDTWVAGLR